MIKLTEYFRNSVIDFLLKHKIAVTPGSSPKEIMGLIKSLRPITTDKPLIRLGPDSDGGYLISDDLDGIKACFSPGVSNLAGFEIDCANRGMDVYMADKSIDELPETHPRFHFLKKFVASMNDEDYITMDKWVNHTLNDDVCDLLLQMDIEGYEYETIHSMSDELINRFRIMVIEFHRMHFLWNQPYFNVVSNAFRKLLQTHSVVHIHPNNRGKTVKRFNISVPELCEITFLRNDRIKFREYTQSFPHPLDFNNTDLLPIILPEFWYND